MAQYSAIHLWLSSLKNENSFFELKFLKMLSLMFVYF